MKLLALTLFAGLYLALLYSLWRAPDDWRLVVGVPAVTLVCMWIIGEMLRRRKA